MTDTNHTTPPTFAASNPLSDPSEVSKGVPPVPLGPSSPPPGATRQIPTTSSPSVPGIQTDGDPVEALEKGSQRVGRLLAGLQEASAHSSPVPSSPEDSRFENQLAVVRLGIATSLFYALRTKHAATAGHCLRVALSCSAWAERMKLPPEQRDRVEVAALLHDLGKIGIPDRILRKPGKLSVDEQLSMELTPPLGVEILRGCTGDTELLDIVLYAGTWYDSRRHGDGPRGNALPLGSRMLAIADAFDSMTTDTTYRRALSRERATQELIMGSHTQFDPELVLDFSRLLEERPEILQGCVVNRWLKGLHENQSTQLWTGPAQRPTVGESPRRESLFYHQLVSDIKDGVAFTDAEGNITQWNDVMRSLTDIDKEAMVGQRWNHASMRLRGVDEKDDDDLCVVQQCLQSKSVVKRSMMIEHPGRDATPVHVTVSPVTGCEPGVHGTVVTIRDLSAQTTMQQELETLHEKSNQDPLTKVANRAHFDERIDELNRLATEKKTTFSLIICDIDHFKQVNDVHGHPAGDAALISFANILTAHSRDGDLVARYGGEEFLLLCPNCDNATAARRAEAIRKTLEETPLSSLNNEPVTASFGVTEFQPGDTAETVLARADRALLKAKGNGRNRVIQLGAGNKLQEVSRKSETQRGWFSWFGSSTPQHNGEFDIVTPVPIDLAIEKLRGFIADHGAEIVNVKESQVTIKLNATYPRGGRRRADQQMALQVVLTLSEPQDDEEASAHLPRSPRIHQTNVHVFLRPIRVRDRRDREVTACYKQVIVSLKSYLMGSVVQSEN